MEFLIDSIDINQIKELVEYLPISGVTSNPSIVKQVRPKDFFSYMSQIKEIIGNDRTLHVQVVGESCSEYLKDAQMITEHLGKDTYIKVPANYEGIKAIKALKQEGYKITATAIYDLLQAYVALEAGADYIAPYVNRIGNLGGDPFDLIRNLSDKITASNSSAKIVGASFKNLSQITSALNCGAQAVTASPDLLKLIFKNQNIGTAVKDFNKDWYEMYPKN